MEQGAPQGHTPHQAGDGEDDGPHCNDHQGEAPDELAGLADVGQDMLAAALGGVDRPAHAGEQPQGKGDHDDPLASHQLEAQPPGVIRTGKMVQVLDQGETSGREPRHPLEHRIEETQVVAGEEQGYGCDDGTEEPGQARDRHRLLAVEQGGGDLDHPENRTCDPCRTNTYQVVDGDGPLPCRRRYEDRHEHHAADQQDQRSQVMTDDPQVQ